MKKILILVVACIIVVGFGIWMYSSTRKTTLNIIIEPTVSAVDTLVIVNESVITPRGVGGNEYSVTLSPGEHTVMVGSSGYQRSIDNITISGESYTHVVELTEVSIEDVAKSIAPSFPNLVINNLKTFSNNEWIVFNSGSLDGGFEGALTVARFDKTTAEWEIVEEGSDLNTRYLQQLGAPISLIEYLGEIGR